MATRGLRSFSTKNTVTRMSKNSNIADENYIGKGPPSNVLKNKNNVGKRKADTINDKQPKKRSAFGDITNVSYYFSFFIRI